MVVHQTLTAVRAIRKRLIVDEGDGRGGWRQLRAFALGEAAPDARGGRGAESSLSEDEAHLSDNWTE